MKHVILALTLGASMISGCASKRQANNDRHLVETMLTDLQKIENESLTPVVAQSETLGDSR